MSYVGDPYKYDIFISYPHAVEALGGKTGLRDWSRKIADDILEYVTMALIEELGGDGLGYYLDRDRGVSAEPLTESLEEAVQKSAILVVLMSPYYQRWCLKELNWFFDQAQDGCLFRRCVLLEVQKTSDNVWPDVLRDKAGERLLRKSLMDQDGFPLGYEKFRSDGALPDTNGLLKGVAIEIVAKLKEIRAQREAERSMAASKANPWTVLGQAPPPEDLLVYLEAEPQDEPVWSARRDRLAAERTIVLPDGPISDQMAERAESVLSVYRDCDALILHRVRLDDSIQPRIRRAFQDRRLLYQKERKAMPWAVLDELPDAPLPGAAAFRLPRIPATDEAWPARLFAALGGTPSDAMASP